MGSTIDVPVVAAEWSKGFLLRLKMEYVFLLTSVGILLLLVSLCCCCWLLLRWHKGVLMRITLADLQLRLYKVLDETVDETRRVVETGCCASLMRCRLSAVSTQQIAKAKEETQAAIAAEVRRVASLSETERQAIGTNYTDAEALFTVLEAGGGNATLILRASWIKTQRGQLLPKRGDLLPPEAAITVAELRAIHKASRCRHGALPVIVVSHFWRTKEHPDPDGVTLDLIITALEQQWCYYTRNGVNDLGLIVDWCALYQAPRSLEQEVFFKAGLKGINQWYAHQGTTVYLVTAGVDRVKGLGYKDKGWTTFEFALAMMIKPANHRSNTVIDWAQVIDLGQRADIQPSGMTRIEKQTRFARPPLSEPLAFFEGHTNGNKTYTNGADRDAIVAPKFRETLFDLLGGVRELNFNGLGWGDSEVEALADVLPLCGQLTGLNLRSNVWIGDVGVAALAGGLRRGGAAKTGVTEPRRQQN